jgi:hypothetical protein
MDSLITMHRLNKFKIITGQQAEIILLRITNKMQREPRNRPRRTHRVSGGIAQLFLNLCPRLE